MEYSKIYYWRIKLKIIINKKKTTYVYYKYQDKYLIHNYVKSKIKDSVKRLLFRYFERKLRGKQYKLKISQIKEEKFNTLSCWSLEKQIFIVNKHEPTKK